MTSRAPVSKPQMSNMPLSSGPAIVKLWEVIPQTTSLAGIPIFYRKESKKISENTHRVKHVHICSNLNTPEGQMSLA